LERFGRDRLRDGNARRYQRIGAKCQAEPERRQERETEHPKYIAGFAHELSDARLDQLSERIEALRGVAAHQWWAARNRSASSAAMHPVPAAVTA